MSSNEDTNSKCGCLCASTATLAAIALGLALYLQPKVPEHAATKSIKDEIIQLNDLPFQNVDGCAGTTYSTLPRRSTRHQANRCQTEFPEIPSGIVSNNIDRIESQLEA